LTDQPAINTGATVPAGTYGPPTNGQVAIISVDAPGHHCMIETQQQVVKYPTCARFSARSARGHDVGTAALAAGDFATTVIDPAVPCLTLISLVAAPAPPLCAVSGSGGVALVTWVGFNQNAHSVL
jgi:hypothetical protein